MTSEASGVLKAFKSAGKPNLFDDSVSRCIYCGVADGVHKGNCAAKDYSIEELELELGRVSLPYGRRGLNRNLNA